jgi:hypothetical protein
MSTSPDKINPLGMSDEDFGNLNSPSDLGNAPPPEAKTQEEIDAEAAEAAEAAQAATDAEAAAAKELAGDDDGDADAGTKVADTTGSTEDVVVEPKLDAEGKPIPDTGATAGTQGDKSNQGSAEDVSAKAVDKDGKPVVAPAGDASSPDYKAMYEQIIAPFKANGKMVSLKDPAEVIQLMQMGANYTRKMQELQPHRKMLMMLKEANLDEPKLSYLIDLEKKDPEAIKKLVKDSGIDPLDIDTTKESGYRPGGNELTDSDVSFRSTLDDLSQTPEGQSTIVEVNTRFDAPSKEELWKQPEILQIIHSQRENGIYALITEEMDRQKLLGKIPANVPFLHAYKMVGDELAAQSALPDTSGKAPGATNDQAGKPAPVIVDTRVKAPKSAVDNDDAASAASSTRGSTSTKADPVNVFAMSDDAFMKQMEGRV